MLQTLTRPFEHFLRVTPKQSTSLEYEKLRKFIDGALLASLGHGIDDEKLDALYKSNKNILLDSCAGSGKSEMLLYKLFLLIKKENVKSNEIVLLSFNKSVSQMLRERAERQFGINCNAMTIHSLAHRILQPKKKILYNKKHGHKALFLFTQRIVRCHLDGIEFCYSYWQLIRLTHLVMQFISRARRAQVSVPELKIRLQTLDKVKAKALSSIGVLLLQKYEQEMVRRRLLDFDQLLVNATEHIHATKGDCLIRGIGMLKSLKQVLIDEYMDTSPLSFNLIQAMRKYNPDLKIFAVGDPRQCIYGFAGSDLYYFRNFQNLFDNSAVCHLTVNRRSRQKIVQNANAYYSHSLPMQYVHNKDKGTVEVIDIGKADRNTVAEKCAEIIKRTFGSVLILTRVNRIFGMDIDDFKKLIISMPFGENVMSERDVGMRTVHSAKGSEADVVIILKSKNSFPLIHPDNGLFSIFGVNKRNVLSEESRLWYVALTRARRHLFIIK